MSNIEESTMFQWYYDAYYGEDIETFEDDYDIFDEEN